MRKMKYFALGIIVICCILEPSVSALSFSNPVIPKTSLITKDTTQFTLPKFVTSNEYSNFHSNLNNYYSNNLLNPSNSNNQKSNQNDLIEVKIIGKRNAEIYLDNIPGFGELLGKTDDNGILISRVPKGVHIIYGVAWESHYLNIIQFIGIAQYDFSESRYQYDLPFYAGTFYLPNPSY